MNFRFLLFFSLFFYSLISSGQKNQINIYSGYALISNRGTKGASIGFDYNRLLNDKFRLKFTATGFYGSTDRLIFPNSETYKYNILAVSKESLSGNSQYPLLTDELKKEIEAIGLMPLDSRIERHFYLPLVASLSYFKRFHNKHEISLNAGLGITYHHAKYPFMEIEGGEVIQSEQPEMIGKDISFIFERYIRTYFLNYSFGLDYNYYFNEKSFIGFSIRTFNSFKYFETVGQFNFNIGTNF